MVLPVQQSGVVTPNHLAAFVTDGVVSDAGINTLSFNGIFVSVNQGVNFNAANTDFPIQVLLPIGYTRYRIQNIFISGAAGTLIPATFGVFTGQAATGIAIVNTGTACTITTGVPDQVNTLQVCPLVNQNTIAFLDPILYFRVQNPQGATAFANVVTQYDPLP